MHNPETETENNETKEEILYLRLKLKELEQVLDQVLITLKSHGMNSPQLNSVYGIKQNNSN